MSKKKVKTLLVVLIAFALFARVFALGEPKEEYFDEVYHAFTARLVLHGDPKAWEWWNTHPEGFAYEWTHPPVAKLAMASGMFILGENSFSWRMPGALLGVATIFLLYLLTLSLFGDRTLAFMASAIFSLEGLFLVMNRVGMNDTYMLFFVLLSLYLFLQNKNFWSALAWGLAISSKWSAIWSVPIFALIYLRKRKKFKFTYLWFLVLPPIVYLASYFQLFLTGHGLDIFWGVQKQMWWYHTNLTATHPYSSLWWQWPLMIRPIYLYTSSEIGGFVSRIYALGSPFVFWVGATSIMVSIYHALVGKDKRIALVVFSYLAFFIPWAASPRVMFLYHYLPAVPFMAIATAYVLRKNMRLVPLVFAVFVISFAYFYPHWAGLNIPLWLDKSYYWFDGWR